MKRLVILISGRGSNMEAIVKACSAEDWPATVAAVISNRPDAAGLALAREHLIATEVVGPALAEWPWMAERSWISWMRVLVWPMFLKYAETIGSRVCSTRRLMSSLDWLEPVMPSPPRSRRWRRDVAVHKTVRSEGDVEQDRGVHL